MKLSLTIQAVDKMTGPVRKMRGAFQSFGNRSVADMARASAAMERLRATALRVGNAIGTSIRVGALGAVAGAGALGKGVLQTAMQFENFEATLSTTMKSSAKAKQAMSWIADFAARTPFEIDEVTKAFVSLNSFSIQPTNRVMTSLGNTAAVFKGMGKTFDDVVQALADAQNQGGFERLKEFGIQGGYEGEKAWVQFSTATGQVRKTVANNAAAIREAVLAAMDANYGGGMAKLALTLSGRLSTLSDTWTMFKLDIAKAGVFDWVTKQLGRFLAFLDTAEGKAARASWAKKISDGMVRLGETLIKVDWASVGASLASIAGAIASIGGAIAALGGGGLDGLFNVTVVTMIAKVTAGIYGFATALLAGTAAAGPIGAIIVAIGALAAGAFLVWRNWDKVSAFFSGMWAGIKRAFSEGVQSLWNSLPAWFRGVLTGATFVVRTVGNVLDKVLQPQSRPSVKQGGGFRFGAPLPTTQKAYPFVQAPRAKADVTVIVKSAPGVDAKVASTRGGSGDVKFRTVESARRGTLMSSIG